MRLGIAVVYLLIPRNQRLLQLHLDQIAANTTVPYTIYGSADRLALPLRGVLDQREEVRVCAVAPYADSNDRPRRHEHAWYLEQLLRQAADDGATHLAVFHVDSFPVERGRAERLAECLDERCVLAGVVRDRRRDDKPMTAGMLFTRDFYVRFRPRMLLADADLASEAYRRYREAHPHSPDSGVGYGFVVHRERLEWLPLVQSAPPRAEGTFGCVYGGAIYHLGSAMQMENSPRLAFGISLRNGPGSLFRASRRRLKRVAPPNEKKGSLRARVDQWLRNRIAEARRRAFERERSRLLCDPQAYLRSLTRETSGALAGLIRPARSARDNRTGGRQ